MAKLKPFPKAKLFCGIIYNNKTDLDSCINLLKEKYGSLESETLEYDFNFTDYYESEMGKELKKIIIIFKKLIDPAKISNIKLNTNEIENKLLKNNQRTINIDPGYFTKQQIILPSVKPSPYKAYLNKGVYSHIVLIFKRDGTIISFNHTFPDFKISSVQEFFKKVKDSYKI